MTTQKSSKYTLQEIATGVAIAVFGGIGLFIATVVLNALVSSPPSRAEFDVLKAKSFEQNKSIDKRLKNLENGQHRILDILTKD